MAESKPNYYAIIPSAVRYNNNLTPNAKLLYGEITALSNEKGFCWAGNEYFSKLYNVSNETISRWISSLKKEGFINVETIQNEGFNRLITISESHYDPLTKMIRPLDEIVKTPCENNQDPLTKLSRPLDEIVKHNNTYNNTINTTNNIYGEIDKKVKSTNLKNEETFQKKVAPKKRFSTPEVEEIFNYCQERNNLVDAQHFFDFYSSKDWMIGKNKMKDWKAAVRTWERNSNNKQNQNQNAKQSEQRFVGRQSRETIEHNLATGYESAERIRRQMLGKPD